MRKNGENNGRNSNFTRGIKKSELTYLFSSCLVFNVRFQEGCVDWSFSEYLDEKWCE